VLIIRASSVRTADVLPPATSQADRGAQPLPGQPPRRPAPPACIRYGISSRRRR